MNTFSTMTLPLAHDVLAPDGGFGGQGPPFAEQWQHGALPPAGGTGFPRSSAQDRRGNLGIRYFWTGRDVAVRHRTRRDLNIGSRAYMPERFPPAPLFQFRALGDEPLAAVAVTMLPWPGEAEIVDGRWEPTVCDD